MMLSLVQRFFHGQKCKSQEKESYNDRNRMKKGLFLRLGKSVTFFRLKSHNTDRETAYYYVQKNDTVIMNS